MSLTLDQARAAVHAVVAAVPALVGPPATPVYDYWRHVTTESEIKSLFVGSQTRVHFWAVVPAAQNPVTLFRQAGSACDQAKPFLFDVHGFYALKDADASEKAFLTIAGAVFEALRTTRHVTGDIGSGPAQWPENDHRMLSGVLTHHVRISFPVVAALP